VGKGQASSSGEVSEANFPARRTEDRHRAYLALRTVLHAVRDRLMPELAVHLGAQLPILVRGFYYEGWKPSQTPVPDRSINGFRDQIEDAMKPGPDTAIDPDQVARAVFALLTEKLSPGEVRKVTSALSHDIRELWPMAE
jgi:uncharacterized protein (DUF2267 family)